MSPENLMRFIEFAESSNALVLFAISLSILTLSMAVSFSGAITSRFFFFVLLGGVTYYLASAFYLEDVDSVAGSFLLNISTELFGAILTAMLLSPFFLKDRVLFPIMFVLVTAVTLPVEMMQTPFQLSFMVNTSTELIGAFVIAMLLSDENLFGNEHINLWVRIWMASQRERAAAEQRYKQEIEWLRSQHDLAFSTRIAMEKEQIARSVYKRVKRWRKQIKSNDITLVIHARSEGELKAKHAKLRNQFHNLQVIYTRRQDNQMIECCLSASSQ